MKRTRANPGDGAALRQTLLDAAERILLEHGTEAAITLRGVATAAQVTTPSVYLHFADKQALVDAVAMRVWTDLDKHLCAARQNVPDPMRALRKTGAAYVEFAARHPVQYRLLMMSAPSARSAAQQTAAEACFAHIAAAVQPCLAAGVFRGDLEQLTLRMWAAVHGCAALLISQPQLPWDQDTLGDEVSRMAGLGTALAGRLDPSAFYPADAFVDALDETATSLERHHLAPDAPEKHRHG
ncbi:TetR/AcrR family transcriptional regulator [Streptomyces misionensis]|uniref:TetR/AcrR family transcriptional regulator n=1 Tax=Streptomyces misionensis TaxID=67331 RepID=UPI00340A4BA1